MNASRIVSSIPASGGETDRGDEIPLKALILMSKSEEKRVLRPEEFVVVSEMVTSRSAGSGFRSRVEMWMNLMLAGTFGPTGSSASRRLLIVLGV